MEIGTVKGKILTEVTTRVHSPSLTADYRPWCLLVVGGSLTGQHFELGDSQILGREEAADIRLPEVSVSRRHCQLFRKRGGYWVADLGATNPTRVNGTQVTSTPILDGDLLTVGDLDMKLLGPNSPDNPLTTAPVDPAPRDPLTGVVSRRSFRAEAESAFMESRQGGALSMIVFDIDHFKHIIDRFGFVLGNRLLAAVGKIMRDHSRNAEVPGRIGGEEFAILLPRTAKPDAMRFAERMRQSIAALEMIEDGEPITLTASFGVAAVRPTDANCDLVYGRADAALYESKRQGRNRVTTFPDPAA